MAEIKTREELYADVSRELTSVNEAVKAGRDYTDTMAMLKTALSALNKQLVKDRVNELSGLDVVPLYQEYIANPFASIKGVKADKDTGLFTLTDTQRYVPFEALDAANPTRKITQVGAWNKMVRILRYNMALMEVRDSGKASSDIALTPDDVSYRKSIGWDTKPTVTGLTIQLGELVKAILPPELLPKTMYKADVKQLMKAIMPETGTGHDTGVTIKREAFFEQKLFAVVKTRMEDGGYLYTDESAEAVRKATKGGKVEFTEAEVRAAAEKLGLTIVETAQDETAQAE